MEKSISSFIASRICPRIYRIIGAAAVMDRADARDVLVGKAGLKLAQLSAQSKVATSSRRRVAQLKAMRADLDFIDIRGNIQTRLRKLDEGQCDAMVLAAAGLLRLGLDERITEFLPLEVSTPAAGQGALAVECRSVDVETMRMLQEIQDTDVRAQVDAERALLDELGGGCSVPIGAFAACPQPGLLRLTACVAALDGSRVLRAKEDGEIAQAIAPGKKVAAALRTRRRRDSIALRQSSPNAISAP